MLDLLYFGMSLENLQLGMGLGKSLYQQVPTKYTSLDGIKVRDSKLPIFILVGLLLWGLYEKRML